jgi:hypothetical protein
VKPKQTITYHKSKAAKWRMAAFLGILLAFSVGFNLGRLWERNNDLKRLEKNQEILIEQYEQANRRLEAMKPAIRVLKEYVKEIKDLWTFIEP